MRLLAVFLLFLATSCQADSWTCVDLATGRVIESGGYVKKPPSRGPGTAWIYSRESTFDGVKYCIDLKTGKFMARSQPDIDATTSSAALGGVRSQIIDTKAEIDGAASLGEESKPELRARYDKLKAEYDALKIRIAGGTP